MRCQIILESSSGVFFPGGIVQGTAVCNFDKRTTINGIQIKLRGREYTQWNTMKYTEECKGDNKFIANQICVANGGHIGPGRLQYPFQFTLPKLCPSSCKTAHGRIWYYVKVTVDNPRSVNYESQVDFRVVAAIDFNVMPGLVMHPTHYRKEANSNCWYCCGANGLIGMDLKLEKEAFVLGETIRLMVRVVNMSKEILTKLNVTLKLHTKEIATWHVDSKHLSKVIARLTDTGVEARDTKNYDWQLSIPSNINLPNFSLCTLFQSWCTLVVQGDVPGCYSELKIKTVVTLGHIARVTEGRTVQSVGASDPPANNAAATADTYSGLDNFSVPQILPLDEVSNGPSSSPYPPGPYTIALPEQTPTTPLGHDDDFETVEIGVHPSSIECSPPSYCEAVYSKNANPSSAK